MPKSEFDPEQHKIETIARERPKPPRTRPAEQDAPNRTTQVSRGAPSWLKTFEEQDGEYHAVYLELDIAEPGRRGRRVQTFRAQASCRTKRAAFRMAFLRMAEELRKAGLEELGGV